MRHGLCPVDLSTRDQADPANAARHPGPLAAQLGGLALGSISGAFRSGPSQNGGEGSGSCELRLGLPSPWPNPETPAALAQALAVEVNPKETPGEDELSLSVCEESKQADEMLPSTLSGDDSVGSRFSESPLAPAESLFAKVRELLDKITIPKTVADVGAELHVTKVQAKAWLERLVEEGVLEKLSKPVCYRSVSSQASLFER